MNFKPVFYVNGIMLLILSGFMMIPMLLDLADRNSDWQVFAASQIVTAFTGFLLIFVNREDTFKVSIRETFLMTCLIWLFMGVFGALPFSFAEIRLTPTQAFFESMSGITTTGATVIADLDHLPRGILLWRMLLHWLGGIGFLVIALAILPLLQVSGMQVFKTQSQSTDTDKILPNASHLAAYLWLVYATLTLICTICLRYAGLDLFDSLCHAMSAVSTGGFSTHDASAGYFNNPAAEWIMVVFMLLGSLPFALYLRVGRGDRKALIHDAQVQSYLRYIALAVAVLTLYLLFTSPYGFFESMRHATFKTVSLVTTTGLVTQDYTTWGPFAAAVAFLLTITGACSGSTAGGIKIFRLQILWSMLKLQIDRLIMPSGVFHAHYNNKPVDVSVQNGVGLFVFAYAATIVIGGMAMMMTGTEFVTAFTGALTAVSNVGPGLGTEIGPAGNFSGINTPSLWVLSACMLLGRLEILTVLVLLSRRFWKP